jgi:hypothetical protein
VFGLIWVRKSGRPMADTESRVETAGDNKDAEESS